MTGEHFTEFIGVIKMTTGLSERKLGERIGSSGQMIGFWKKNGVSRRRAPLICNRLRKVVMEEKQWTL